MSEVLKTHSSNLRPDSQFVMPQSPEQLEEMFSRRLAAIKSAAQSPSLTPSRLYDPSGLNSQYGSQPRPAKLQEVPQTSYRNTTSVSCNILKANRLTEHGNDNAKRRDIILKVLKTGDDTSHIILIALESIINYKSIYLTVILFDFMAYAS